MNYGEEFLKVYNNEFLSLKKDFIKNLIHNFEADETFVIIFDKYVTKLYRIQEEQYSKDSILIDCWEEFWFRYSKYKKNALKNIINKNILEKYNKNQLNKFATIWTYSDFIVALARLSVAKDFEKRIKKDIEEIEIAFDNKDVSEVLKVKKQENAEYLIEYSKPFVKPQTKEKNKNIPKEQNEQIEFSNPFSKDEKFILLHYMLNHERKMDKKLSTYEVALILKITSGCFSNKDLVKKRDTDYEKLHKGYKYYSKTSNKKKELMKILITKIRKFSFIAFEEYLLSELHEL